jgi:hypothetical protein
MDQQDKPILSNVHPFCLTGKHTVPEWAFKLNSVLVAEETWHLNQTVFWLLKKPGI